MLYHAIIQALKMILLGFYSGVSFRFNETSALYNWICVTDNEDSQQVYTAFGRFPILQILNAITLSILTSYISEANH